MARTGTQKLFAYLRQRRRLEPTSHVNGGNGRTLCGRKITKEMWTHGNGWKVGCLGCRRSRRFEEPKQEGPICRGGTGA